MANITSVDWVVVEREYRAAQMSISAICVQFNITRQQLNAKVDQFAWTRNLQAEVASATQEQILRRTAGPEGDADNNTSIADKVADRTADLVMGHRGDLTRLRALATKMTDRLTLLLSDEAPTAETGDIYIHPLDNKLLGKTDGTIAGLVRLTDAFAKIITLERQAYGLDDPNAPVDADAIKSTIEAARQELISRGTFSPSSRRVATRVSGDRGPVGSDVRDKTTH